MKTWKGLNFATMSQLENCTLFTVHELIRNT